MELTQKSKIADAKSNWPLSLILSFGSGSYAQPTLWSWLWLLPITIKIAIKICEKVTMLYRK